MAYGWHALDNKQRAMVMKGIVDGEPIGGPYHLEIHPTNKCNAKCEFCNTEHFRFGETIAWEMMEEMILTRAGGNLNHVRLVGGGEPLIHPKTGALIETLGKSGIRAFDLITNGIQLKIHARALIENGCDEIHVSLNEPRADLYERTMRIPAKNFDRVIEGIKKAVEARDALKETRTCRIVVQLFLNNRNLDAVESFADWAREIGVDLLDIRSAYTPQSGNDRERLSNDWEEKAATILERQIRKDHGAGLQMMRIGLVDEDHVSINHRINKVLNQLYGKKAESTLIDPSRDRDEYCLMPWYSMTIMATGAVSPCCRLSGRKDKELGNINETPLLDVWRGQKYRDLRRQMRQVMLTRGNMRHSPKKHTQICDFCIKRFDCFITFGLADRTFYSELKEQFDRKVSGIERLSAHAEDRAVRTVHWARSLTTSPGTKKNTLNP